MTGSELHPVRISNKEPVVLRGMEKNFKKTRDDSTLMHHPQRKESHAEFISASYFFFACKYLTFRL